MPSELFRDLDVQGLSADGRAVCREDNRVIFVRGGLPGQRIRARLLGVRKRFAEGVRTELLRPAPDAVPAACPHAALCGGCPLQEVPYEQQLFWKRRFLRDALTRIGGLRDVPLLPILPSPLLWGYRNKMEFAFAPDAGDGPLLGLRQRQSHAVTEITNCRLMPPPSMVILARLRELARESGFPAWDGQRGFWRFAVLRGPRPAPGEPPQWLLQCLTSVGDDARRRAVAALGRRMLQELPALTAFVHDERRTRDNLALGEHTVTRLGEDILTEHLGGHDFSVPHNGFFQVNAAAAEHLCGTAREMAALAGAERLWDLYCGVGAPGLCLAGEARELWGLEATAAAVVMARRNAAAAGCGHCRYAAGDIRRTVSGLPRPDVALADPPRNGLHAEVTAALLRARPRRIVYISCNPATLARDVALLHPVYAPRAVRPVDLFPHTPHVESLTLLELQDKK